jgi:hypothetical protein
MTKKIQTNIFRHLVIITFLSLVLYACNAKPTEVVPNKQPIVTVEATAFPSTLPQTNLSCRFATVFDPENFPCSVDQLKAITGLDLKAPAVDTSQFVFIMPIKMAHRAHLIMKPALCINAPMMGAIYS